MSNTRFTKRLFAAVFLLAQSSLLLAQFDSATVLGTIRDASGGAVPNASVTLQNVKTGVSFQTKTDANGDYQFTNKRLGSYTVRVEQTGFQTATAEPFDLTGYLALCASCPQRAAGSQSAYCAKCGKQQQFHGN